MKSCKKCVHYVICRDNCSTVNSCNYCHFTTCPETKRCGYFEPRMEWIPFTVDESTANAYLKLLEIYVNSTGLNVIGHRGEDGKVSFEFENLAATTIDRKDDDTLCD